jgi:hypothetical protein
MGENWGNDNTGNFVQIWDIQVTRGYWPVKLRTNSHFVSLFGGPSSGDLFTQLEHNSPLLDLYNVKYVVTSEPLENIDPGVDLSKFELVRQDYYAVYLNKKVLPRAFVAPCLITFPDDDSVAEALNSTYFDPWKHVLLSNPGAPEPSAWWINPCVPIEEVPNILEYTPTKITRSLSSPREGYLVISDNYYPGWTAFVDGNPSEVMRADLTFRSIKITSGTHTVIVFYDPKVFRLGFSLTIISITGLAFFFLRARRRTRVPIHCSEQRPPNTHDGRRTPDPDPR